MLTCCANPSFIAISCRISDIRLPCMQNFHYDGVSSPRYIVWNLCNLSSARLAVRRVCTYPSTSRVGRVSFLVIILKVTISIRANTSMAAAAIFVCLALRVQLQIASALRPRNFFLYPMCVARATTPRTLIIAYKLNATMPLANSFVSFVNFNNCGAGTRPQDRRRHCAVETHICTTVNRIESRAEHVKRWRCAK